MKTVKIWRWQSGSLLAVAAAWCLGAHSIPAASYLSVTGPAPLREAAPRPTCVLSANPPLTLDNSNPRFRADSTAVANTNAAANNAVLEQPAPPVAVAPAVTNQEPPFEHEAIVFHAGSAEQPSSPVTTNLVVDPIMPEPVAEPQPLTPQMLLPMLLARPHAGGAREEPTVVVPVDFQPPEPVSSGKSSARYQSK